MVALAVRETEQPFLEDRIATVPEGKREAQELAIVGETGESVLTPAVGPRPRLVVAEVGPGLTVGAVVLADGSPLPLREVRTPPAPRHGLVAGVRQALVLGTRGFVPTGRCLSRQGPLLAIAHRRRMPSYCAPCRPVSGMLRRRGKRLMNGPFLLSRATRRIHVPGTRRSRASKRIDSGDTAERAPVDRYGRSRRC